MNNPILPVIEFIPEDVIETIKTFIELNDGDEATCAIIYATGAQILGISVDELIEKI